MGDDLAGVEVGGLLGGRAVALLGGGEQVDAPLFRSQPEGLCVGREAVRPDRGEVAVAFADEDGEVWGLLKDSREGAFQGADVGEVGRAVAQESALARKDGEAGAEAEVDGEKCRWGCGLGAWRGRVT